MNIRPASMDDLDGLLEIEVSCFGSERFDSKMLTSIMLDERNETFVAEEGHVIIGSAMVHHDPGLGRSRILSIAILPSERERGKGRALLEHLEEMARSKGSKIMELEVRIVNVAAIGLYLSSGYRPEGIIPNYFGRGEDALYMERSL